MSLINKALKKAQAKTQPQEESSKPPPENTPQASINPSLHSPRTGKGRWYLIALLLAPAMTLLILTSKWNKEKRHYREEIAVLTSTPITPVAKHDFRSTKKHTPLLQPKSLLSIKIQIQLPQHRRAKVAATSLTEQKTPP